MEGREGGREGGKEGRKEGITSVCVCQKIIFKVRKIVDIFFALGFYHPISPNKASSSPLFDSSNNSVLVLLRR